MPEVISICGPTATGKTDVAIVVARELGGEVINADALQVYRRLEIGTAKPTAEQRAAVPHPLIDILEPDQGFSAGEFARLARQAIEEIHGRGRHALVVGGTGLYLRALFEGISPIPRGSDALRSSLSQRLEREGLAALRRQLEQVDPVTARRLAPADRQRILRALEVHAASGLPLSTWIERQPFGQKPLEAHFVGLTLPRGILYDRIAGRVVRMFQAGWVDEVKHLLNLGLGPEAPAFKAIGYRQIVQFLAGELSRELLFEEIVRATRRFAKRQMTWFRKQAGTVWFENPDPPLREREIVFHLRRCGVQGVE